MQRGVSLPLFFAERLRVENSGWQIELLFEFQCPLLAKGGRTNDKKPAFPLSPVLTQHYGCLDGFPETHFVGKDYTFGNRRFESEQGGFDLVGIEVYAASKSEMESQSSPLAALRVRSCAKYLTW